MFDLSYSLLAQAAQAAQNAGAGNGTPGWLPFAIFLAATVPAYLLGVGLAKWLRVPDYANKIGFILLTISLGTTLVALAAAPDVELVKPKFGIDLRGGVILVYEIDAENTAATLAESGETGKVSLSELVSSLNERLNPGGINEIQIRAYGEDQVEIVVPDVSQEEIAAIKRQIENTGQLEFLILATDPQRDEAINIVLNQETPGREKFVYNADGEMVGKWARVFWDTNKAGQRELAVYYSNAYYRDAVTGELLSTTGMGQDEFQSMLKQRGIEHVDALMVVQTDPVMRVTGSDLAIVRASTNNVGNWVVEFTMNDRGAEKMGELTGNNTSDPGINYYRYLGIVLDGNLRSAPSVNSRISYSGEISGRFTRADVEFLTQILRSGKLPAVLQKEPISENQISPLLGQDTIDKGIAAITISIVAVLIFMVIYYRFAGVVACVALVMNTILVVAAMILMKAAFTLPGLAGMVLSVGMSVDANVLIFERIREELARGAALRMAIRNGFSRAMTTIIDSNVTTIITAVVLYVIGTEQLKGFAVTLILGIAMSMYTAIFVARVIFDVAEKRRFISALKMMDFWGKSQIDFVRLYMPMTILSVVLVVVGVGAAVVRGSGMFDVDFNGGSTVEMLFKEEMPVAEVRQRLSETLGAEKIDFTLTEIQNVEQFGSGRIYKIETSIEEVSELERKLEEIFRTPEGESLLASNAVEVSEVSLVSLPAPQAPATNGTTTDDKKKSETTPPAETPAESETSPADDKKKTDAAPAEEEKPADLQPAPETPADDTPADAPPADEKKTDAEPPPAGADEEKADDASADKADADKSDAEKSDADQPSASEEKPADEPATDSDADSPAPAGDSARRNDVPADLLALAQDEDAPAADAPAADTKDDADAPQATDPAPAPKDDAPAAETSDAEPKSEAPGDSATTRAPRATGAGRGPTSAAEVTLSFEYAINASTLAMQVTDVVRDMSAAGKLERSVWDTESAMPSWLTLEPDPMVAGWRPDSSAKFKKWKVTIESSVADVQKIVDQVEQNVEKATVWTSSSKIGSKVAAKTREQALWAVIGSMLGIIAYVWFRFHRLAYGLAAVVALVHDVLVTVALIALSAWLAPLFGFLLIEEFKISMTVIAAILTLIGYSLNDTIVTFDRIREIKGKSPELTPDIINRAINETLSRTFLTAGTTLIVVLILYAMGGAGIHGFAFAMLVGVIAGTYSSVFIAAPILLWMAKSERSIAGEKQKVRT